MDTHLSRWSLVPILLVSTALAVGCRDVVEPRDADGASPRLHFTAFDPSKADSAALAWAEQWAEAGDSAMLSYIAAERNTAVDLSGDAPRLRYVERSEAGRADNVTPNWSVSGSSPETASPLSPENWRNAEIYNSSVVPFVSGKSGAVLSKMTYSGNWGKSKITFKAYTDATDIVPSQTVEKQGKSGLANCLGDGCWHVFDLNTTINVDLGRWCGAYLQASGTHEAMWSALAIPRLAYLGTWGQHFAVNSMTTAYNGDCAVCGQLDARRDWGDGPRANLSCSGGGGGGGEDEPESTGGVYALQICRYTEYYHPETGHYLYTIPGTCRVEYHAM